MRREAEVVKKPLAGGSMGGSARRFSRHFQGYELGLVTVAMVLTFAVLVLPRGSQPSVLPLPQVEPIRLRAREVSERTLALRAEAHGLPFEVRAVGESVRHFGQQAARGADTSHDLQDIRNRVKTARASGQSERLLELRAVQTSMFLRALQQFEQDGYVSRELEQLGGTFLAHARRNDWLDARGQCLADAATRAVLYRVYWTDLLGESARFPFAPSLDEWRAYYAFLLRHPERDPSLPGERAADSARLRVVLALERKDPDYPAAFAKGYLLYRLGDPSAAATAFRSHLATHDGGRYALLARNYLIHTLRDVSAE